MSVLPLLPRQQVVVLSLRLVLSLVLRLVRPLRLVLVIAAGQMFLKREVF